MLDVGLASKIKTADFMELPYEQLVELSLIKSNGIMIPVAISNNPLVHYIEINDRIVAWAFVCYGVFQCFVDKEYRLCGMATSLAKSVRAHNVGLPIYSKPLGKSITRQCIFYDICEIDTDPAGYEIFLNLYLHENPHFPNFNLATPDQALELCRQAYLTMSNYGRSIGCATAAPQSNCL